MKIVIEYSERYWRQMHNKFTASLLNGERIVHSAEGPTRADAVAHLFLSMSSNRIGVEVDINHNIVEDRTGIPQHRE